MIPDVLVIGHRGCAGLRPENTMSAFRHAFELGVDGIEFDVHLSRDGKVVINHDFYLNSNLARNTDGSWVESEKVTIVKHTYEHLKSYKLGQIKPHSSYQLSHLNVVEVPDESLPSLMDVLNLAKDYPSCELHIELKTNPLNHDISSDPFLLTQAVLDTLKSSGIKNQCRLLAFDWRIHEIAKNLGSSVPRVFLYEGLPTIYENPNLSFLLNEQNELTKNIPAIVADRGGAYWSVEWPLLSKDIIEEAHQLGLKVNAWTPNSKEIMENLIHMGVDAITTDRPDILKSLTGR